VFGVTEIHPLHSLLSSPLRCRIASLDIESFAAEECLLTDVAVALPQLRQLSLTSFRPCCLPAASALEDSGVVVVSPLLLPLSLRSLLLTPWPASNARAVQQLFGSLAHTLHLERLYCFGQDRALLPHDFASLLPLSSLLHLHVPGSLTAAQISVLQQFSALQTLEINGGTWSLADIELLCSSPHKLHALSHVELGRTAVGAALPSPNAEPTSERWMRALASLPNLSRLVAQSIHPSCWPLLSVSLPQLSFLSIDDPPVPPRDAQWAALQTSLASLKYLTRLSFCRWQRPDCALQAWLPRFLTAVPQLRSLMLSQLALDSLDGVAAAAPQLQTLKLLSCRRLTFADVWACTSRLPHLIHFTLIRSMPLTEEQRLQFQPPLLAQPKLTHFHFRAPDG
jgi:hypothetical protein